MNTISYISNAYNDLYPSNSHTNFKSFIPLTKLTYIPDIPLSVGITSVTFKLSHSIQFPAKLTLGIKSLNLSTDYIINGSNPDSGLLAIFSSSDNETIVNRGQVFTVYFEKPVFFPTNKEHLQQASFQIINISTDKPLEPLNSDETPTLISCLLKPLAMHQQPLTIILNSDDTISKTKYHNKSHTHFTVQLPRAFEFHKDNWLVGLKSLHMTSKLFNVREKDYGFQVIFYEWLQKDVNGDHEIADANTVTKEINTKWRKFYMEPGCYNGVDQFTSHLNRKLNHEDYPLLFNHSNNRISLRWNKRETSLRTCLMVKLSGTLAHALGFRREVRDDEHLIDFNPKELTNQQINIKTANAVFNPNINLLRPKNIFVNCNIVNQSVVGSQSMRLLRIVSTIGQTENEIMSFPMRSDDFARLEKDFFESIEIKLTDNMGRPVQATYIGVGETVVALQFIKM